MRYGLLGTGEVGRTLASELVRLGHEVRIGTRNAARPHGRGVGGGRRPGREQRHDRRGRGVLRAVIPTVGGNPAKVPDAHQIFVSGDDGGAKEQATVVLGEFGRPAG
ncbi:NAD(P)-binding domain-containing protein [Streptomyces sp. NPDC002133]|uniref:NAD(P)-binding domain-containing protein n=1 Tax=Streptomyces sp. NPDC002133 TaxID=3154409 RepID=UPI00332A3BFE